MAEYIRRAPMRLPMSVATGAKAILAAGATEAGGQQSLTLAIVAGAFVVVGSVAGPLVAEWVRRRRRPPTDHHAELGTEQAELVAHLLSEINEKDAEIKRLRRRRG